MEFYTESIDVGRDGCFDPRLARPYILGAVVGAALGDAVGLQADGFEGLAVAERYPEGLTYPSKAAHKGFPPNAWTDATEQMILTMRTLAAYIAAETDDPCRDLAARLGAWYKTGTSPLDDRPRAAGQPPSRANEAPRRPPQYSHEGPRPPRRVPADTTTRALAMADFLQSPCDSARAITGPKADNAALYRVLPCAFTAAPDAWARMLTETTHADERCVASSVMLATLICRIVQSVSRPEAPGASLANLALQPVAAGRDLMPSDSRRSEYMRRLTDTKSLARIGLGSRDEPAYVLKTLSCAMWAFRQLVRTPRLRRGPELFRRTILELAAQGGSACANCAVAGAVIGAALGVEGLPADWRASLPFEPELVEEAERFIAIAAPTW